MTTSFVVRRLLQLIPAVAGIVVLTFILIHAAPGDPIDALASEGGSQEYLDSLRTDYGLDQPLPQQLLAYAGQVVKGDFGTSIIKGLPVSEVVRSRLQPTLLLTGTALGLSTLFALFLGQQAARRPFGAFDAALRTSTLILYAMPAFWLAQLAILTVALRVDWIPVQGFTDAKGQYTGTDHVLDIARHLVLPSLVLAASEVALLTHVARTGLLQEIGKDYARTARAKGLTESRIISHHALRNVALPVVTIIGSRAGFLLSGAVVVETVFAWPGLGTLLVESARAQDHPVVLALVIMVALSVAVANLATDLVYGWVDPRVRHR